MSLGTAVSLAVNRIIDPVEGMHRAIATPWLAALGTPVRAISESFLRTVYGSVRLGAAALGAGVDAFVDDESRVAAAGRAIAGGLWSDAEPGAGVPMTLRNRQGAQLTPGSELAAAIPMATGHLVVLVHGLVATERCWHGTDVSSGLLAALEDHPALTPLSVRYTTGLAIASNGAALATLLDEVESAWPVPVESIALVGHSMGGLVVRRACAAAATAGHRWIDATTDLITIGSPHRGAPLEKLVVAAAWGLGVAPQSRPLAEFLDRRSRGIKDLRWGDTGSDVAELDIRHHFIGGVVTADPAHPVGAVVGDLMVRPASSTHSSALDPTNVAILGAVHHFHMLNEPAVVEHVMDWLTAAR